MPGKLGSSQGDILMAMLGVLLGGLFNLAAVEQATPCSIDHPEACRHANHLAGEPWFHQTVQHFLGKRRESYLYKSDLVSEQLLAVIGGPSEDVERIGSYYRFTGCRYHSCTEKGAVVLGEGKLIALGILHSSCALQPRSEYCFAEMTLTLYVREPDQQQTVVANLSAWAKLKVAEDYVGSGLSQARLVGIQVVTVTPKDAHRKS